MLSVWPSTRTGPRASRIRPARRSTVALALGVRRARSNANSTSAATVTLTRPARSRSTSRSSTLSFASILLDRLAGLELLPARVLDDVVALELDRVDERDVERLLAVEVVERVARVLGRLRLVF